MGIGEDGHTAGIPARNKKLKVKNQINSDFAISINDFPGKQKERITMTFNALSMLDLIIILVFGKEKKKALQQMFKDNSIEKIPAKFFLLPEISKKALLITDQKI